MDVKPTAPLKHVRVSSTSAKLFSAGAYFYAFFCLRAAIFSYSVITSFRIILFQISKLRPAVLGLLFPTMYNMTHMRIYKKNRKQVLSECKRCVGFFPALKKADHNIGAPYHLTGDARLEFLRNSRPAPEMREH